MGGVTDMTINRDFWIVLIRVETDDDGRPDPPACWRNVAGSTDRDHALELARMSIGRGVAALVAKVEFWEFPDAATADPMIAADALAAVDAGDLIQVNFPRAHRALRETTS